MLLKMIAFLRSAPRVILRRDPADVELCDKLVRKGARCMTPREKERFCAQTWEDTLRKQRGGMTVLPGVRIQCLTSFMDLLLKEKAVETTEGLPVRMRWGIVDNDVRLYITVLDPETREPIAHALNTFVAQAVQGKDGKLSVVQAEEFCMNDDERINYLVRKDLKKFTDEERAFFCSYTWENEFRDKYGSFRVLNEVTMKRLSALGEELVTAGLVLDIVGTPVRMQCDIRNGKKVLTVTALKRGNIKDGRMQPFYHAANPVSFEILVKDDKVSFRDLRRSVRGDMLRIEDLCRKNPREFTQEEEKRYSGHKIKTMYRHTHGYITMFSQKKYKTQLYIGRFMSQLIKDGALPEHCDIPVEVRFDRVGSASFYRKVMYITAIHPGTKRPVDHIANPYTMFIAAKGPDLEFTPSPDQIFTIQDLVAASARKIAMADVLRSKAWLISRYEEYLSLRRDTPRASFLLTVFGRTISVRPLLERLVTDKRIPSLLGEHELLCYLRYDQFRQELYIYITACRGGKPIDIFYNHVPFRVRPDEKRGYAIEPVPDHAYTKEARLTQLMLKPKSLLSAREQLFLSTVKISGRIKHAHAFIEPLAGHMVSVQEVLEEHVAYGDVLSVKDTRYQVTVDPHRHRRLQLVFFDEYGEMLPVRHTIKVVMDEHTHAGAVIRGLELVSGNRGSFEGPEDIDTMPDDGAAFFTPDHDQVNKVIAMRKDVFQVGMQVSYVHVDVKGRYAIMKGVLEKFDGNIALIRGEEDPIAAGFLALSQEDAERIVQTLRSYPGGGAFRKTVQAG